MDEEYDVVICGTGLTECILSGLLSQKQKKILHIDRNGFYGGEGASLNLTSTWKLFRNDQKPPEQYGANRDWNIDLIPKFIMANGNLVKILLKTLVSRYLEWKSISGTYVYQVQQGGIFSKGGPTIAKVPSNDVEAAKSSLMGLLEKRRCKNFFVYIQNINENDQKTWKNINIMVEPFKNIVAKFDLEDNTIDFIGHAVALYTNDNFLNEPSILTIRKLHLYFNSVGLYGESPFIYPVYGLGGIPEGFTRMCAIQGGTFMLNQDIDEILFDENNQVRGVRSGEQVAKCKMVICSPSYVNRCGLNSKVKSVGKCIRAICLLDHPIPNTKDIPSVQIILPQRQTGRNSDIYVMMVSAVHQVAKKGYYIAIISAMQETNKQPVEELAPAFDLIGSVKDCFITVNELFEAVGDQKDNVIVTDSLNPTSHFEGETENVLQLYKKITGEELDLVNLPDPDDM